MAPEVRADPYPTYAELRRNAPVCQVEPGGVWAVSRYEDVLAVLKDPQTFSSEGFHQAFNPPWLKYSPVGESLVIMDPPQHTRLRALVNRAFLAAAINRLEPFIRASAERLVDTLIQQRSGDFIEMVATPLPIIVIAHMIGMETASRVSFLKRVGLDVTMIPTVQPHEVEVQQRLRADFDIWKQYMQEVLEEHRRQPAQDIITELLQARVDGQALSEEELLSLISSLIAGGLDTTGHLLGHMVLLLAERPELLEQLRAEPSRIPAFVEETLRYEPVAHSIYRSTTREVELAGSRIPAYSQVLVLLGSANRDERHFPNADQFLLDRQGTSVAFGHGIHYCLGALLARMEARLLLEALVPRVRGLKRNPEPVRWTPSIIVRGPMRLPVQVLPA